MKRRDVNQLKFWLRLLLLTVPLWFGGVGFLFGWWSAPLFGVERWAAALVGLLVGLAWWGVREFRGRARFQALVDDSHTRRAQIALLPHDQARRRALDSVTAGGNVVVQGAAPRELSLPDGLHPDARELFSHFDQIRWRVPGVDMDLGALDSSLASPIPEAPHQWIVGKMREIDFVLNARTGRVLMGIPYEGESGDIPEVSPDDSPSLWHFILERFDAAESMAAAHCRRKRNA